MAQRRRHQVAVRSQVVPVEPGCPYEPPVQEGRRVGDASQCPLHGCLQEGTSPDYLREHRARHAERHRRLQHPRYRLVARECPQSAEHAGEDLIAAPASSVVRVTRSPDGDHRQRHGRFHQRREPGGFREPEYTQPGRSWHTLDQGDPLFRAQTEFADPAASQHLLCRRGGPPGLEHPANAHQRPECVRQVRDLPCRSPACARHRRHDPIVEEIRQSLAQLSRHRSVARQERHQPDREDRPGLGRFQPGRTSNSPREQKVALMRHLLFLGEADRGQLPHAGVDTVHSPTVPQCCQCPLAPLPYPIELGRLDADGLPGRDRADDREVRRGCYWRHRYRYLGIVRASCSSARCRIARPTAISRMARPRCQNKMRSSSRSRPGSCPVTIWPSSACSDEAESRPLSTCRRSAPNRPDCASRQSSTTTLSITSSRSSSTALIVPYGTTKAPGLTAAVRSSTSGMVSRDASTRMSAPSKTSSALSVARTGVSVTVPSCRAKDSRDSGLRLVTRISSRSKSSSSSTTFQNAVPRAPT